MLYTGSFDGPLYLGFLKRFISSSNLKRFISSSKRKLFLIVDRHPVHTRRLVQDWLAAHKDKIGVFYLPSYSPQLNPVEYLNNDVKQQVHVKPPTMSAQQLKQRTAAVLMSCRIESPTTQHKLPSITYAA